MPPIGLLSEDCSWTMRIAVTLINRQGHPYSNLAKVLWGCIEKYWQVHRNQYHPWRRYVQYQNLDLVEYMIQLKFDLNMKPLYMYKCTLHVHVTACMHNKYIILKESLKEKPIFIATVCKSYNMKQCIEQKQ